MIVGSGALLALSPKLERIRENGGKREAGDLPKPNAGDEESEAEGEKSKKGAGKCSKSNQPCMPVSSSSFEDSAHSPKRVEYLARIQSEAVVRHVPRNRHSRQNPEHHCKRVQPTAAKMNGGDFHYDRRRVVLDHAKKGYHPMLHQGWVVPPCRPRRLPVLHVVGNLYPMPHVQYPTDNWNQQPQCPNQNLAPRNIGLKGKAEGR